MSENIKCPICKGTLEIKEGTLEQTYKPIVATVKTCIGGGEGSMYGCGYKTWRAKVNSITT